MLAGRVRRTLLALAVLTCSIPAAAQAALATLDLQGNSGQAAAVNTTLNRIYVAGSNGVTVVDGATNNVISNIFAPSVALAVNAATNKIYAIAFCQSSCSVYVIDGASNTVQATVPVGANPVSIAVNPATNKIYVVNNGDNTVTMIDGATNSTATIPAGVYPTALAINSTTNKIYVVDQEYSNGLYQQGYVAVIDGATNNVQSVQVGFVPVAIAVNPNTDKIYVAETQYPGQVWIIDGATNNTTAVDVGDDSSGIGVDSATNKIYVVNTYADIQNGDYRGSVTVIDGVTNNTSTIYNTPSYDNSYCRGGGVQFHQLPFCTTVAVDSQRNRIYLSGDYPEVVTTLDGATDTVMMVGVGDAPGAMALNPATDRIYVPDSIDNTLFVIDPSAKLQFVPVTPCRVVDTRGPSGTFGGPAIQGGANPRAFPLPQGGCNIAANAIAYSLNATVVPHGPLGYLTLLSSGGLYAPGTSTMNSYDGRAKADAVILQAGISGGVSAYASDTTDLILDINGYFVTSGSSTLAFFSLPPCRVVDTRGPTGALGGPPLARGVPRSFPILEASGCNIPSSAQAYSMNFTVVPSSILQYLTVWPTGDEQPVVSTLNDYTGTIVANAAIVPAGTGGAISTYASDNTNLIVDISGYFAPASSGSNPLSLYTLYPCRGLDTRIGRGGEFSGELVIDALENPNLCPMTAQAQAYVFNATVIPIDPLEYLTLWPDGENQPVASTLNAIDGAVTSNMAIVPTTSGLIDAYTTALTHLLLDFSGYFAP